MKGVAAVELAIIFPFIILICTSAVTLGSLWSTSIRMDSIAQDVVRVCGLAQEAQFDGCVERYFNEDSVSTNCRSINHSYTGFEENIEGRTVLSSRLTLECNYMMFESISAFEPITLTSVARGVRN